MDVSTIVSKIFLEFDDLDMAAKNERQQATFNLAQRRKLVVALMTNVVKPFADHIVADAKKRDISITVDDRGNDPLRPSYAITFASYENKKPIVSSGPSIKLTADAECHRIDVAEEMGESDTFDDLKPISYAVEMGQSDTMAKMMDSLTSWLRDSLKLVADRK